MNKKIDTKTLTTVALLLGITVLLANTPLGVIPIGPIFATTLHIPVLVAAILMGPRIGALMGFFFGAFSMFRAFTQPTATSFIFMDPLVSVLPRIAMGYLTGVFYQYISRKSSRLIQIISFSIGFILLMCTSYWIVQALREGKSAFGFVLLFILTIALFIILSRREAENRFDLYLTAALGTALNTFGVLGLVYLLHAKGFMEATGRSPELALGAISAIAVINGIPEILVATILVSGVVGNLIRMVRRR